MRTCRMALAALAAVAALPVLAAAQSYPYGQTAPGYIAPGGVRPYPYVWPTPTPVRFCRRDAATKQRCKDEFLACAEVAPHPGGGARPPPPPGGAPAAGARGPRPTPPRRYHQAIGPPADAVE